MYLFNQYFTPSQVEDFVFRNKKPATEKASYLFDETFGLSAIDSSGNGNTGTIDTGTYNIDVPFKPRMADVGFRRGVTLQKYGLVVALGTGWEAGLVESPCVFADPVSGQYAMVYVGYDNPNTHAQVGLAYSTDLLTWTKSASNPIFGPTLNSGDVDENGTSGPVIYYEDGVYYLFYIGLTGTGYEAGTKRLCLATATSLTGTWTRRGAIISPSGSGWRKTSIWHASIVKKQNTYYLFFNATGDGTTGSAKERIGYATATSLLGPWTVDDTNSPLVDMNQSWESDHIGDPSVYYIPEDNMWYMAYYGATSAPNASDGIAYTSDGDFPLRWKKYAANPILVKSSSGTLDNTYAHKPFIFLNGNDHYHFYTAVGTDGRQIALARSVSNIGV